MKVDINSNMKMREKIEEIMSLYIASIWGLYLPEVSSGRILLVKNRSYDGYDCMSYALGLDSKYYVNFRCSLGCLINLVPEPNEPQEGDIALYFRHEEDLDTMIHVGRYQRDMK
jgi:hypothetical protein